MSLKKKQAGGDREIFSPNKKEIKKNIENNINKEVKLIFNIKNKEIIYKIKLLYIDDNNKNNKNYNNNIYYCDVKYINDIKENNVIYFFNINDIYKIRINSTRKNEIYLYDDIPDTVLDNNNIKQKIIDSLENRKQQFTKTIKRLLPKFLSRSTMNLSKRSGDSGKRSSNTKVEKLKNHNYNPVLNKKEVGNYTIEEEPMQPNPPTTQVIQPQKKGSSVIARPQKIVGPTIVETTYPIRSKNIINYSLSAAYKKQNQTLSPIQVSNNTYPYRIKLKGPNQSTQKIIPLEPPRNPNRETNTQKAKEIILQKRRDNRLMNNFAKERFEQPINGSVEKRNVSTIENNPIKPEIQTQIYTSANAKRKYELKKTFPSNTINSMRQSGLENQFVPTINSMKQNRLENQSAPILEYPLSQLSQNSNYLTILKNIDYLIKQKKKVEKKNIDMDIDNISAINNPWIILIQNILKDFNEDKIILLAYLITQILKFNFELTNYNLLIQYIILYISQKKINIKGSLEKKESAYLSLALFMIYSKIKLYKRNSSDYNKKSSNILIKLILKHGGTIIKCIQEYSKIITPFIVNLSK